MRKLYTVYQLSWHARGLLVEAFCLLGVMRAAAFWLPFRRISPHLGRAQQECVVAAAPAQQAIIEQIGWTVRSVSRYTPWISNCMAQAMTAKWMLRRRGIASTLYLGVHKVDQQLAGHAWLRAGAQVITGGGNLERFKQVAWFGEGHGAS